MATSSGSFCSLCQEDNTDSSAVSWCTDCMQFLCSTCEKQHRKNKASKYHNIVLAQNYLALPDFIKKISHQCKQHNERFESYCAFHECACCVQCITEDHKKCPDLRKLSKVLTNVKTSASMSHIDNELTDLLTNHDKILKHLYEQKTTMTQQKNHQINEIKKKRELINLHLDKLENEFIQQLEQEVQNQVDRYDQLADEVVSKKENVQLMKYDQTIIKTHATDLQTLIAFDLIRKELEKETKYLRSLHTKEELLGTKIELHLSPALDSVLDIDCLGDILFSRTGEPLELDFIDTAQFPVTNRTIEDIRLSLLETFDLNVGNAETYLTGCALLPSGDFVIADLMVPYVKYYNKRGVLIKHITTNSNYPLGVCCIDSTTIAILVALSPQSSDKSIILTNTAQNNVMKQFDVGSRSMYLSFDKQLVVGQYIRPKFLRLNKDGEILNEITRETFEENSWGRVLRYVTQAVVRGEMFAYNNMIYSRYCKPFSTGVVECIDEEGNVQWKCQNRDIGKPHGIAVDKCGFTFVASRHNNSVIAISPDGQRSRIVIDQTQGLLNPKTMSIDHERNQLMVCNSDWKVFIYQL